MEVLKECPFCGSSEVSLSNTFMNNDIAGIIVECGKCACMGPDANSKEEAIAAWNRRP